MKKTSMLFILILSVSFIFLINNSFAKTTDYTTLTTNCSIIGNVSLINLRYTETSYQPYYGIINSHAELGNQTVNGMSSNGSDSLCVSNRTCNANYSNAILWLSGQTNAHVAINVYQYVSGNWIFGPASYSTTSSTYKYPICTNDYVCRNTTSSCATSETTMFSLSSTYNSHVNGDVFGNVQSDSNYNVKICCNLTTTSSSTVLATNWTTMDYSPNSAKSNGYIYQNAATVDLNDFVNMWPLGKFYEVYEEVGATDKLVANITLSNGKHYWYANASSSNAYYFKVNGSDSAKSQLIQVKATEDDADTIITIKNLSCGKVYNLYTNNISYEIDVSDIDTPIEGMLRAFTSSNQFLSSLEFGFFNGFINGSKNSSLYLYYAGEKKIELVLGKYIDMTNTEILINKTYNIIAVNSSISNPTKLAAACIDEPEFGDEFETNIVEFNATSTIAVYSNGTSIPYSGLWFNWTFYDSEAQKLFTNNSIGHTPFNVTFTTTGKNRAALDVTFISLF